MRQTTLHVQQVRFGPRREVGFLIPSDARLGGVGTTVVLLDSVLFDMRIPLSIQIYVRGLARRAGLTRAYLAVKRRFGTEQRYEAAFDDALRSSIAPGDVVWDVGANVGRYTVVFSELVGQEGHVVAFEPVPATFDYLSAAAADRPNVTLLSVALGAESAVSEINVMSDARAGTHSLVSNAPESSAVSVTVERGDQIRVNRSLPAPNVIKIDVEGFEYEVLLGIADTLELPTCRAVMCEVHFGVLAKRGLKRHPQRIEEYLQARGFSTRWVDASHLAATRGKGHVA
jgi:FkbM family methyltransferase